ncbi:MAG: DUF4349 domain-containing protein, partial [Lewinella sp.]|nr:DUF4349 domain-containing protein [Lewinella sp.]
STVTINLYQKVAYQRPPETYHKPFGAKVKQGFLAGWNLLQQLFIGLITIWPIVLILGLIWVFRRRLKWWGKK